ncbi:NAD(P)-binding protein [Hesseltinella vesiculosa]|uniref:NAD(P)-binding protein n=1 Tax=Hesseltinella vesiculosa TaxID=101127 RepID=A0A1X2GCJ5_9FUNG|nr:NAD(P)-binding protein [Hesseltinella vesiculosa]
MTSEKVFVVGGTGNVGKQTVRALLASNVPVTLFARNPAKVKELFGDSDLVSVVQGDLDEDLTPIKQGIVGHTRAFLLCAPEDMAATKGTIAQYAFEAGVKQIVDISSISAGFAWRANLIGYNHFLAEKRMVEEIPRPKGAHVVTLRPSRFMSNAILYDRPHGNVLRDVVAADQTQSWISPNDIGALAALILQDDINKHGDGVYDLIGDVVTVEQRRAIFESVLGQPITYERITATEKFNTLNKFVAHLLPFPAIVSLATLVDAPAEPSLSLPILLGREPETLEQFISSNKAALQ